MEGKKILVVDDEPEFLEVAKIRLTASGYDVITASDGREAINKIKKEKPDAVLLDIVMPEYGGLSVLKRIRRIDKNLPIFIMTAFSNEDKFELAKKLDASGFIVKTSDLKKEIANITSFLRVSKGYKKSQDQ
ncbi:response regulator [Candidatus Omnitrophota bacterium]